MDRAYCWRIVGRYRTPEEAQARADDLDGGEA
jgi:hypothetical protein